MTCFSKFTYFWTIFLVKSFSNSSRFDMFFSNFFLNYNWRFKDFSKIKLIWRVFSKFFFHESSVNSTISFRLIHSWKRLNTKISRLFPQNRHIFTNVCFVLKWFLFQNRIFTYVTLLFLTIFSDEIDFFPWVDLTIYFWLYLLTIFSLAK